MGSQEKAFPYQSIQAVHRKHHNQDVQQHSRQTAVFQLLQVDLHHKTKAAFSFKAWRFW